MLVASYFLSLSTANTTLSHPTGLACNLNLTVSPPLPPPRSIQPGDCIVAFSRRKIFAIKEVVERETGLKACVIYGNLPPETRRQQALLFNEVCREFVGVPRGA